MAILLGLLFGLGTFVIGLVKTGALEDHTGAARDQPFPLLAALGTFGPSVVIHFLKCIKFVSATRTPVPVRGHSENQVVWGSVTTSNTYGVNGSGFYRYPR